MSEVLKHQSYPDVAGVDISKNVVTISYCISDSDAPTTVNIGEKTKRIPLCISKEREMGRWYVGEDAVTKAVMDGAIRIDNLFEMAKEKEQIKIEDKEYTYEELFASFLRRVLNDNGIDTMKLKKLVLSVNEVNEKCVELISSLNSRLALSEDCLTIIDHKESYIYYALNQNQNIFVHDVVLFEYINGYIYSFLLDRDSTTKPQIIKIHVDKIDMSNSDKDKRFLELIEKVMRNRIVTSVFLVGEGFENDWMIESVNMLCKGRRVFLGDNLYSKGACFAGRVKLKRRPWNYVYIGDHEMKMNLSLKILDRNDLGFISLVDAGESWYETGRECEVILDGPPEFECWIQSPESRKQRVQLIELRNMPKRENRTSRLRISAIPISDVKVLIKILDLGFGDIAPASGKIWEHVIDMEDDNG